MLRVDEYAALDGVALAEKIRTGDISAEEAIEAALKALETVNGSLNAVTGLIEPPARACDTDPDAPFFGVPYLLKDLSHGWSGVRDDKGSRLTQGYIEQHESLFASRSRQAGLIAIARTNTPEFGMNGMTEPRLYGPTANPWDITRSPGGSSGGSAAAVAAGVTPFAYANDGGGSIRLPAAWCGLVGLKPSRGVNPARDVNAWILAEHVVSRTVRDTAKMLDVTAGPDKGAYLLTSPAVDNYASAVEIEPKPLRIGMTRQLREGPSTNDICIASLETAAKACETLGHEVCESVPNLDYPEICQLCSDLYTPCIVPYIDNLAQEIGREPSPDTLEPPALTTYRLGMNMKASSLIKSLDKLAWMSHQMEIFMEGIDIWLTPAVSQPPCLTGEFDPMAYRIGDPSFWHQEMALYTFLPLASITGQPSLVLPINADASMLPTGIQLVGPQRSEHLLFQLAGQLERTVPWSNRHPKIHAANSPATA